MRKYGSPHTVRPDFKYVLKAVLMALFIICSNLLFFYNPDLTKAAAGYENGDQGNGLLHWLGDVLRWISGLY